MVKCYRQYKFSLNEYWLNKPATLLAKPLSETCNHHNRCFGVKLTDLVAAMVPLCISQISTTSLCLTWRWRNTSTRSSSSSPSWGSSPTTSIAATKPSFFLFFSERRSSFILLLQFILQFLFHILSDPFKQWSLPLHCVQKGVAERKKFFGAMKWKREFIGSRRAEKKGVDHRLHILLIVCLCKHKGRGIVLEMFLSLMIS